MKITIIGVGNVAPFYIKAFINKASEIILCSRTKPKTYKKLTHYSDYKDKNILKSDLIVIATPPYLHLEMINYFLKHKKKIIVEKPAVINSDQLKELLRLVPNKNLYLAYHSAFNPIIIKMNELIRDLKIKNIKVEYDENAYQYHPDIDNWIFNKELSGGGCLIDSGINVFSILYQFIPKLFIVSSSYKTIRTDVEDSVRITLKTKNNINVNLSMNWNSKREKRFFEFLGKDNIRIDLSTNKILINKKSFDLKKKITTIDLQSEYNNMISDAINYFKFNKYSLNFNPLLPLEMVLNIYSSDKWLKNNKQKAIIISAGGVKANRTLPTYVISRLEEGVKIYNSDSNTKYIFILTGRETLYKPPVADSKGFPIIESELMADYLLKKGISKQNIRIEKFSSDSLGSAIFSKILLIDPLEIRDIVVISSNFHIKRLKEIYNWIFNLDSINYKLKFVSTPNKGVSKTVLLGRKSKEKYDINQIKKLKSELQNERELLLWLFSKHAGYSFGLKIFEIDNKILTTY